MADNVTRGAARIAALVAVPVALVVGLVSFNLLNGPDSGTKDRAVPSGSAAPQPSSPVSMSAPQLTERQATVCRAFAAKLPTQLRDRAQRPVTAGAEQNAAYGEPPITVACGTPTVTPADPTDKVYPLNGVCWYPRESATGTTWTTLDRAVQVTVTVPKQYESPGQWVIVLSSPVAAAVPSIPDVPYGCRLPAPSGS